ncbi:fatty acid desaturase family protein [Ningiella sp. W23]|uniref:fatty acid desaturase family protein n=1 Tax=Ningiella sp. W23 TaxID=3023715 RepID=UPI003757ABA0
MFPHPLVIVFSTLIIGVRQLGLAILVHDCGHNALFTRASLNDFVGHYLCGSPICMSLYNYRKEHNIHHMYTGQEQDPDLKLVEHFPVSKASMARKILRDMFGITGIKLMAYRIQSFNYHTVNWILFHGLLLTGLILIDSAWTYLMWWAAELFVFPLVARIRHIGEHGSVRDRESKDPRENTNTTLVNGLTRSFIAPNHVNYHVEHHLIPNIPPYNLKRMHNMLKQAGFYNNSQCIQTGYRQVISRAISTASAS